MTLLQLLILWAGLGVLGGILIEISVEGVPFLQLQRKETLLVAAACLPGGGLILIGSIILYITHNSWWNRPVYIPRSKIDETEERDSEEDIA